jgi:hypothetical protein
MQHSFDISIATKYGVNVAIFLNNIAFWIQKNIANRVHEYNGTFWTYNSQPAFLEIFPYWTIQNLKTVIKDCIKNNLILIDNFNEQKYDKTSWYCLSEKGLSLFNGLKESHDKAILEKNINKINIGENQPINKLKLTDGQVGINRPIPDSNTDNKPDREHARKKPVRLFDNFKPDKDRELVLHETSLRVGISKEKIIEKFKKVMKTYKKTSNNWQSELEIFCYREKATNVYRSSPICKKEIKSTVKYWEPGNQDYDRLHGIGTIRANIDNLR